MSSAIIPENALRCFFRYLFRPVRNFDRKAYFSEEAAN